MEHRTNMKLDFSFQESNHTTNDSKDILRKSPYLISPQLFQNQYNSSYIKPNNFKLTKLFKLQIKGLIGPPLE